MLGPGGLFNWFPKWVWVDEVCWPRYCAIQSKARSGRPHLDVGYVDNGVSYDQPGYATLHGVRIKITSVAYEQVE